MKSHSHILWALGSLRFAAMILVLLAVAMVCATVYESMHGTERALAHFYGTRWFAFLLLLLAINISASVVARFPFKRKQIGFLITHASILVILVGACITKYWATAGKLALFEGQTVRHFQSSRERLSLCRPDDPEGQVVAATDLPLSLSRTFHPVKNPRVPTVEYDDLSIKIERYLPDSRETIRVKNDNPANQPAIEAAFSVTGFTPTAWVFAEESGDIAGISIAFQIVEDNAELNRILATQPTTQPVSKGTLIVEIEGREYKIPVEQCMRQAVPIKDTDYTVRVLQHLFDARISEKGTLQNATSQPYNPAVLVRLVGPEGASRRVAFARFPEFAAMHGKSEQAIKVTLQADFRESPQAPVEVLAGSDKSLYARFTTGAGPTNYKKLSVNKTIETPWSGMRFGVLRYFDHARREHLVRPVKPVRQDRVPALQVTVQQPSGERQLWLRKYDPVPLEIGERIYEISYANKQIPLGFDLKLDSFRIGRYPGTSQPRSFESRVKFLDPQARQTRSGVISMNHPMVHGDYTLFQSSYRQDQQGRMNSILSVSSDPGQPIVFAGFAGMIGGMLWIFPRNVAEKA